MTFNKIIRIKNKIMKHLKVLFLVIPVVFLISCSGNNSSADAVKSSDDTNSSPAAPAGGDAHFSCTVDGQAVSGGAIDVLRLGSWHTKHFSFVEHEPT
jgi:hypothetical protein